MVVGSITSQRRSTVGASKNGSMTAVLASGIRIMSDSLMPFHPEMEEPSNILPSRKRSSSTSRAVMLTCCSLPRVSVKRRSANFTCFSFMSFNTSLGVISPYMNAARIGQMLCSFGTEVGCSLISGLLEQNFSLRGPDENPLGKASSPGRTQESKAIYRLASPRSDHLGHHEGCIASIRLAVPPVS